MFSVQQSLGWPSDLGQQKATFQCFLHQSAVLVKLLYQLAKLRYTMFPETFVAYRGWFLSHVCPSWAGSASALCHLLPRNQIDKAASIRTTHSSLSNTVLVMPVVPEKLLIAYLFTLNSVLSHCQIFLVWTKNYMSSLLSRLLMISWQRKKRCGKNTNWLLKVSGQKWLKSLLPTFHRLKSTPEFSMVRTYNCPQGAAANILNKIQPTKVNNGKHEDKLKWYKQFAQGMCVEGVKA